MWTLTMTLRVAKTRVSDLGFSALNAYRYRILSTPTWLGPLFTLSATLARLRCLGERKHRARDKFTLTSILCSSIYPPPLIPITSLFHSADPLRSTMNPDDENDRSSSTPTAASKSVSGQDKEKPRLTDQEKKNNHIASEQKRRAAIREGFDRLTELVPGLEGQGRSESVVLQKTVDFMHLKLQERHNLIAEVESKGGHVDESLRPS